MRVAIVEAMIDLSQKPIPTRIASEATSPITRGEVRIFSRPGATDPQSDLKPCEALGLRLPCGFGRDPRARVHPAASAKTPARSGASTDAMPGSLSSACAQRIEPVGALEHGRLVALGTCAGRARL